MAVQYHSLPKRLPLQNQSFAFGCSILLIDSPIINKCVSLVYLSGGLFYLILIQLLQPFNIFCWPGISFSINLPLTYVFIYKSHELLDSIQLGLAFLSVLTNVFNFHSPLGVNVVRNVSVESLRLCQPVYPLRLL